MLNDLNLLEESLWYVFLNLLYKLEPQTLNEHITWYFETFFLPFKMRCGAVKTIGLSRCRTSDQIPMKIISLLKKKIIFGTDVIWATIHSIIYIPSLSSHITFSCLHCAFECLNASKLSHSFKREVRLYHSLYRFISIHLNWTSLN